MKFVELNAQYQALKTDIDCAIEKVLAHGQFIMGPEVAALEADLANYVGAKHVVSCASGTDALMMSLMAHDIGPGDAVFTTPFTFFATAEVIGLLRATPVFVDVDPNTFNIDAQKLAQAIADVKSKGELRARGVIPVDLFGLPADYDAIEQIAAEHNMFVLQDAAQSIGGSYKGRKAGSQGDVAATSFFPTKTLGAYGDGGAIFTEHDHVADALRSIRFHGQGEHQYDNIRIGVTGRLDTMQAAILRCKLKALPDELAARAQVAAKYNQLLGDVVTIQHVPEGYVSSRGYYSVLSDNRDQVRKRLSESSIPTALYYAKPLHLQPVFSGLGYGKGAFPEAEMLADKIFSLPIHGYLSDQDVDTVCQAVIKAVKA